MTEKKRIPLPHPFWLAIIGIVLGILLAIAGYGLGRVLRPTQVFRGAMLNPPVPAVDFRLQGPDGLNYSLYNFQEKPVLLTFSCTSCSRNSALLNTLAQTRERAINDGFDFQSVVISIDPERDTPEMITEYVQSYDSSFIGLSGDKGEISDLAHSYDIYFHSSPASEGEHPQVEVTPLIMLIDSKGYWRAVYPLSLAAEDIAADIKILLDEER